MYNLNTNSLRNRRTSVVTNYNIPPRGPSGPLPILNPLPGDGAQPTTGSPVPGQGNSGFRVPNQAGSNPTNSGGTSSNPSSNPKPQTVSLPQDKKAKKTKQKSKRKTTRSSNFLMPSSDRPELLKFTGGDRSPTGDMPYRDGPSVFTPDRPFGKISELPNAGQFIQPWDPPADIMNNVRTLIQIISPIWFPQFPSQATGSNNDDKLSKNQENVFLTMFNQIRYIYQERFNINLGFTEAFTVSNVFVYFFDVHALHAELVCLLQRAAYYRNLNAGMENLVLDNLACVLNNIDIDSVRNRMARALRFSYLPKSVIDETYETFQSYRMSGLVTSPSTIYVTKNMGNLLKDLGAATTLAEYTTAVETYSSAIDILISRVVDGRPANTSTTNGIQRYWNWSNSSRAYVQQSANIFAVGDCGLTLGHQIMLNSVFARVAPHTNLTLLNNVMEGNSRSEIDVNFNDRYNNQLTLGTSSFVMPIIQGGVSGKDAPKDASAVAFASDRRAEEVSYKSVMYQSEKFPGGGALFFATDRPGNHWSRIYLKERAPVSGLQPEQDVRFTMVSHYTRVVDNTYPFVQDNYVAKAFTSNGTSWHYTQNTDSNSAAMWYVTFGDLMEQQYQHGIDILK